MADSGSAKIALRIASLTATAVAIAGGSVGILASTGGLLPLRAALAVIGLAIASFVVAWVAATRWVTTPARAIAEATRRLAKAGVLGGTIEHRSDDEIGEIADAVRELAAKVEAIPATLRESARALESAIGALDGAAKRQAQVVQQQAAGLSQASATAEEIKQTSTLAASKSEMVMAIAQRASQFGGAGQDSVASSMESLKEIQAQIDALVARISELAERTLQVGEIIETVKDIADQSNVLALNAAIEATKAGEYGKGFAVVAREIRTLADQSIQSTGRIREILAQIQASIRSTVTLTRTGIEQMGKSMKQIRASGESLQEIAAVVEESSHAARQIAAAVNQQNAGIGQLSSAIRGLNDAMSATMTDVQAAGEATERLKGMASSVQSVLATFRG